MADYVTSGRVQNLVLSVVAVGSCAWLLYKRSTEQPVDTSGDVCVNWKQVMPPGAENVEVQAFGETSLQAKLIAKRLPTTVMRQRSKSFFDLMSTRRTMRFYSKDDIPRDVLENCLAAAGTSPSGAHHQPWYFALIRSDKMKSTIRDLVEAEEKVNYERRMRKSWIQDLSSMTGDKADARLKSQDGGAPQKPYLTEAPVVLAMFKQTHGYDENGHKVDNYYVNESCGIAAGFLITALHNVGLATLTSTPMGSEQAIREMLGRPDNEKLFLLMPIGYPASDATVPYRTPLRKPASELYATY